MNHQITIDGWVPVEASGQRFDQVVASLFPEYSRARLQSWIKSGELTLNGQTVKPKAKVVGGEHVQLSAQIEESDAWQAEPMELNIVFEDEQILVVNKPINLVVHPAPGNYQGTLLNGLLYHLPSLSHVPRAGIVHRLDKDTTGLMVVAKTLPAQTHLVAQMQARSVSRQYVALLLGHCKPQGRITTLMGRDPKNRKKMAVVESGGKEAITHYGLIERLGPLSLVRLKLETGRTHQIRVHMSSLGFPIIGDQTYGRKITKSMGLELIDPDLVKAFSRQALHAESLALIHPATGEECAWKAPWPDDMTQLINACGGESCIPNYDS